MSSKICQFPFQWPWPNVLRLVFPWKRIFDITLSWYFPKKKLKSQTSKNRKITSTSFPPKSVYMRGKLTVFPLRTKKEKEHFLVWGSLVNQTLSAMVEHLIQLFYFSCLCVIVKAFEGRKENVLAFNFPSNCCFKVHVHIAIFV